MIEAKIILDSISPNGVRLTTFELKYPRFILAEFNTHRVFSRNSSSSRAIPVLKLIKDIISDPVYPVYWGENKPGMQAEEELKGIKLILAKSVWKVASLFAVGFAYTLTKLGLHKQIANRIIEPWMHTKTIVSATEWNNFFSLRCHKDAQPEIHELAVKMKDAYDNSKPRFINYNEWHLPYITDDERNLYSISDLIKMSVARCARVSYLTHDGQLPNIEKDFELYDRLVGSVPIHASPSEHQASPLKIFDSNNNFSGWLQHRTQIQNKIYLDKLK